MSTYAKDTSVSVEKSRAEIETILARYGADRFGYMTTSDSAVVAFQAHGRSVRFHLPLPNKGAREFTHALDRRKHPPAWVPRRPEDAYRAWEQACRQRWRALALVIKAKLEAVECGITSFEKEFLAHIVLPNGATVGEWMGPQLEAAYSNGTMPPLLGAGS